MTLAQMTFAATFALAVVAQATIVGLLVSGWSVMDIYNKAAVFVGSIVLPFLIGAETLVLIGVRLLSAVPAQACDFYCNNLPANVTMKRACNATYGPNPDCFVMGTALSLSASMVACPLGIWLFFYVMYRWEQSSKHKTE